MKLVAMTQIYNANTLVGFDGETDLNRFMKSVSEYADGLVVFDDGSTDSPRNLIMSYIGTGRLKEIEILGNEKNTPYYEGYHRARSLEHCRRLEANYVLSLDVDEVLEPQAENTVRAACEGQQRDTFSFKIMDLWRTNRFLRVDNTWSRKVQPRLWSLTDEISFNEKYGLRSSIIPDNHGVVIPTTMNIIHYGYSTTYGIIAKYNRFKSLGIELSEVNESNLRLTDARKEWFRTGTKKGPTSEVYDKFIKELIQ